MTQETMKITLLVNWDSAAVLALTLLAPSLAAFDVSVLYTRKKKPVAGTPRPLNALAAFEEKQLHQQAAIFDQFDARCINDINGKDFHLFLGTQPDLVISIRHMSILKEKVITVPKLGVINLHSGLLPAYQGVMATFWAMQHKEATIGTTLHFIEDSSIDTGPIISQSLTTADYTQSYHWNMLSIYQGGCQSIIDAITVLTNNNTLEAQAQRGRSHYFSFPTEADLGEFKYPLF